MKKLISMLLILILMIPAAAWACTEEAPRVVKAPCCAGVTLTDPAWWPATSDHMIPGRMYLEEKLSRMGAQHLDGCWIAGKMENGWMREAAEILTVTVDGQTVGLTKLGNTSITIYPEYVDLALSVIRALLGEDAELTQENLVYCAIWWNGDYCSLITHPSWSDRFEIGYATFNGGEDVTPWYLGHFGECLRFGLACGFREAEPEKTWEDVNITAEAQANAEAAASASVQATASAQASTQASAAAVSVSNSGSVNNSGDGCYRNNTFVQVNLFSLIWQGIKNITNQQCAE